jgi:hypothetical protein
MYNNSLHGSTMMTPFWAMYNLDPELEFTAPILPANIMSAMEVDAERERWKETHRLLRDSILRAQE